ncbi:hypothetical protein PAECIP111893_00010 [Paenibacillus plantiphilus]|uniref:Normocyte-binding protein n=1 Tax=Paenibacillus plantiphilus TaxID=2905650 RepID=A0ABM9BMF6_9BACL|nr:normocyte-binding protein [Paenibacillus plantiphilus]CAH1189912.1 hypothetical protein PAECIP111893_00010 [Paenibacillus plantiphilus]
MKDIVLERLGRMEDLEGRRLLKGIMTSVFLNLVEHQEEMTRRLEQRVFDELEDLDDKNDIYVTLCAREDIDPIHEFLYPMLPSDVNPPSYDLTTIVSRLSRNEESTLFTMFMQCDYMSLKKLFESKRTFRGQLVTTGGRCAIEVRLQQNLTYVREIEKLYETFQKNGISWKTVNHPYAYKFVDIILTGCERTPDASEEIMEISVDCEEYERSKRLDVVPLWNIERLSLKNSGFPVPAMDRINYEHVLSLRKTGSQNGYLVDADESDIRYMKRSEDELTIVTPLERSGNWNVLKLTQPVPSRIGKLEYSLVSNRRSSDFIGSYARKQATVVRAKGEIMRIAHSFEAAEALEFVDASIQEKPGSEGQTYGMNPFISDHVRTEHDKRLLRLSFRRKPGKQWDEFIIYDLMSFLVSEVQMYFPEYKCEGVWA